MLKRLFSRFDRSDSPDRVQEAVLPKDLARKVRRIEISTNRLVDQGFAGRYHSVFKGRGMEFAEVRPYQPGDEIRSIDWNVTARMDQPFVKRLVEERDLTVFLAVDVSGIDTLAAYADTLNYLEAMTLVRAVAVEQVSGDTMKFRLAVRGDAETLRRALALDGKLVPSSQSSTADTAQPAERLRFRYQP